MQEKYGFVYIWYDRKHKRYYIGSHWGKENDGYICSSKWMLKSYQRRPQDFKRRILSRIYTNRLDTFIKEEEWLNLIKEEEIKIRYYNLHLTVGHWTMYPDKVKTVGEKISIKLKEKIADGWSPRDSMSEEAKEKQKIRMIENNPARKEGVGEKITKAKLGVKRTKEQKEKMSIVQKKKYEEGQITWNKGRTDLPPSWNKGLELTKEHKEKLSIARKNLYEKGFVVWNKGISYNKGIKFYNNGIEQKCFFPGKQPEGWILGKIKK